MLASVLPTSVTPNRRCPSASSTSARAAAASPASARCDRRVRLAETSAVSTAEKNAETRRPRATSESAIMPPLPSRPARSTPGGRSRPRRVSRASPTGKASPSAGASPRSRATSAASVSPGPPGRSAPSRRLTSLDRDAAAERPAPLAERAVRGLLLLELVLQVADDLLEHVLERDDAERALRVVDDHGQVHALLLERAQQLLEPGRRAGEERRAHDPAHRAVARRRQRPGDACPWRRARRRCGRSSRRTAGCGRGARRRTRRARRRWAPRRSSPRRPRGGRGSRRRSSRRSGTRRGTAGSPRR